MEFSVAGPAPAPAPGPEPLPLAEREKEDIYSDEEDADWERDLARFEATRKGALKNVSGGQGSGKSTSSFGLSQRARNDIARGEKVSKRQNHQGRDDRATTEQVMDPRTRLLLFKMLSSGVFKEMDGCISTGKEANVYHAKTDGGESLAVKVFKTSILVFKDRDKYVTGEYRYKNGYCKSNPRKMVKMWAEKEMRNLKRLHLAGIRCPEPRFLRSHILVMTFIGKQGWPAPRLKDAGLSASKIRSCYLQSVKMMRAMYQRCRLVHGDLSEYNILYMKGHVYFIDVSQSVETDHPRAMDFMRMDCFNMTAFFKKFHALITMGVKDLFEFIVDDTMDPYDDEAVDKRLRALLQKCTDEAPVTHEEKSAAELKDKLFMEAYIPNSLSSISAADIEMGKRETSEGMYIVPSVSTKLTVQENSNSEEDEDQDDGDEWLDDKPKKKRKDGQFVGKDASKEEKRAHKKAVKAAARERRKKKTPKHVKKRATKKNKG